ncbi:hypothetical protein RB195_010919 [Necator americanus]|uniref:Uncharacterized protein n=1 Tax=Necator americanus TaxID=51031 RepID=A0ABR1D023_NECAM
MFAKIRSFQFSPPHSLISLFPLDVRVVDSLISGFNLLVISAYIGGEKLADFRRNDQHQLPYYFHCERAPVTSLQISLSVKISDPLQNNSSTTTSSNTIVVYFILVMHLSEAEEPMQLGWRSDLHQLQLEMQALAVLKEALVVLRRSEAVLLADVQQKAEALLNRAEELHKEVVVGGPQQWKRSGLRSIGLCWKS